MNKVLIISYYWPPAGGPGVQRWLKFVKYLRDFDVEPVVYVPENPQYPITDSSFLNEVPKDITIYKQPIFEPYRFASLLSRRNTKRISSGIIQSANQSLTEKFLLWIRGNFFIPDARKYWVRPSVEFLHEILKKEGIGTIITTGPPHSVHLIGHFLKQHNKVQWIADFRDPWTSIGYHKKLKLMGWAKNRHKELEALVLNTADKLVVTSETTKREFRQLTNKPIKVITNGFDTEKPLAVPLDQKFTISHIGSMLSGRNPQNLWQVLAELVKENIAFNKALCLQFIGVISKDVLEEIKANGLEHFLKVIGYVPHDEALAYQQKSQVLLLAEIDSPETTGIIPGKLFEYMASGRPILGVGPKNWEVSTMVAQTKTGAIFEYTSHADLKNVLLNWFHQYEKQALGVSSMNVERYSRRELTRQLAEYI
ncbi:glycosyltransferase family 4 protein [Maribacter chungangensis]|uniref:Glycosyltransferase family 4 protein n=1 Tax=Maribacter chungangensis TaxID=1069117 RepID=A0ABW3B995_9FLAO